MWVTERTEEGSHVCGLETAFLLDPDMDQFTSEGTEIKFSLNNMNR